MRATNKLILTFLALSLAITLPAQNLGEIRGKVFDPDGTPVFLANVSINIGGDLIGTTTDVEGRFEIKALNSGTYTVMISSVGFQGKEIKNVIVLPGKSTAIEDQELAMGIDLPPVEIVYWERKLIDPEEPGKMSLRASEFAKVPTRKTPVKMIAQQFAGVSQSLDGEGLYFRGSRTTDMVYIVDGVKQRGSLTGVPGSAISSLTVYTGGLPACYGDVTGGVVVIETKNYLEQYEQWRAKHRSN